MIAPPPTAFSWRAAAEADTPFLRVLHDLNRPEFALLPENVRVPLLDMQYRARQQGYQAQYPQAATLILLHDGEAVGQMLLDEQTDHLTLVDFAVLPGHQGQGVGTAAMKHLQEYAGPRRIHLQVAADSPAEGLYRKLGFHVTECQELRLQMTWTPATPSTFQEEA